MPEFDHCLLAKAKYALGVTTTPPHGKVTCTLEQWKKVLIYIAGQNKIPIMEVVLQCSLYEYWIIF